MATIILASGSPSRLAPFLKSLENVSGEPIQLAESAEAAIDMAEALQPVLMVIDQYIDWPVFALVKEILSVNALINTAVISDQSTDAFHDTAEGLGILMQLPEPPAVPDADMLWKRLKEIAAQVLV